MSLSDVTHSWISLQSFSRTWLENNSAFPCVSLVGNESRKMIQARGRSAGVGSLELQPIHQWELCAKGSPVCSRQHSRISPASLERSEPVGVILCAPSEHCKCVRKEKSISGFCWCWLPHFLLQWGLVKFTACEALLSVKFYFLTNRNLQGLLPT